MKLYNRFQLTAHCGLAKVFDKNLREKNNVEYAKYRWSEWAMSQRIPKGVFITHNDVILKAVNYLEHLNIFL